MMKLIFLMLGFVLISPGYGQQKPDTLSGIDMTIIAQVNQGSSYLTFPADIGNIEPLWFEGNLIPNFYIRQSANARLMGVLTPQIIIRMYQEESYPVRTPSYMPQITVYYFLKEHHKLGSVSVFGRLAHHSNGQDSDFFLEDGSYNRTSGSFSTNYIEGGFISTRVCTRFNAHQFFKSSFGWHPESAISPELMGIYSRHRWHNSFSIFKLPAVHNSGKHQRPAFSVKGEFTWMFGNYNSLDAFSPERVNLSLTLYYHPDFLEDIGLFVQYYHGSDYYNMYFDHRLDVVRFGFMTEKLRF